MKTGILTIVIIAQDVKRMVNWYKDTFNLSILRNNKGGFPFVELGSDNNVLFTIVYAERMGLSKNHKKGGIIVELYTEDIKSLFERIEKKGGHINFLKEEKHLFGSFTDPEGNQMWVIEIAKTDSKKIQ